MRAALLFLVACGGAVAEAPHNEAAPTPKREFHATLTGDKLKRFDKLTLELASPCGKAHSLRTSMDKDPSCARTPHAMGYLERMISRDVPDDILHTLWTGRYGDRERKQFDVSRSPVVGSRSAAVKIVVWEDLQCPHCAHLAPMIQAVEQTYGERIAVFYKMFPLKSHTRAREAAIAAIAANKQGKFLSMTDLIFEQQQIINTQMLEEWARTIDLDMPKFRADIASPEVAELVDADLAEADAAQLDHVPDVFINGRLYEGVMSEEDLKDAVQEELDERAR
jgi:predicted DsbA family dithiol-disulfide isomerase